MKTQGEVDKEMIGRDLKVYVKTHAPNIPTGADYHILAAKSAVKDIDSASKNIPAHAPEWYTAHYTGVALEHIIRALELIQQEREKEKESK